MGLYPVKKLLYFKRDKHQNEDSTNRTGENLYKLFIGQDSNIQNIQRVKKKNHTSNNPINKWLNELNRYFSKNEVQDHVWWLRPIIPVIWEAEIWRIVVRGHLGQKVSETPISTNKLGMVVYACNPRYMGSIGGRITI
jgi:hypothetical protein